ncbi:DUF6891 domain-containing protein [Rhodococcus sp. ACT016]|uniref:DUF6891 domain-containing protein n=1 Tax=Rhodococcus sp. ACT016 TaxID=3134808 RepID=UPI003D26CAE6
MLNTSGVVARTDFSWRGSCASGEIWEERDDSRHWRSHVHFHQQDTDGLVEDGESYIGYGAFSPEEFDVVSDDAKEDLYSADVVFPVFPRHGSEPEWNRDLGTRVLLENSGWCVPIEARTVPVRELRASSKEPAT